jgi:hypothetical protein
VTALGAHSGFLRRLTTHLEGTGREIIADRVASEVVQRQVDGLPEYPRASDRRDE